MLNNIKNRKEGFTIIEVLIVLAIAGLILLVVFLAVPALQRNSRNQQRRTDVSNYLAAVSEWSNNNGGGLPAAADLTGTNGVNGNVKLGTMTAPTTIAGATANGTVAADTIVLVTGAKCAASGNTAAGSTRQFAVRFQLETGGGTQTLCQES